MNLHGSSRDREPLPTRIQGLPVLPEGYAAALAAGLRSIPAELTPDAGDAIAGHVRLLLAWNRAINLTGIREPERIATGNVLDSLAALPVLREAGVEEFVDIGSGAGFPGLPLAVALPAGRALLVDSVAKKARFLSTVVDALEVGDRVEVVAVRSEDLAADPGHRGRWQAALARAVAELSELAELALPLLEVGGILVAWKRRPLDAELETAERALPQLGGHVRELRAVSVPGLEGHVLVVLEKTAPTPDRFPRPPAKRRPVR